MFIVVMLRTVMDALGVVCLNVVCVLLGGDWGVVSVVLGAGWGVVLVLGASWGVVSVVLGAVGVFV